MSRQNLNVFMILVCSLPCYFIRHCSDSIVLIRNQHNFWIFFLHAHAQKFRHKFFLISAIHVVPYRSTYRWRLTRNWCRKLQSALSRSRKDWSFTVLHQSCTWKTVILSHINNNGWVLRSLHKFMLQVPSYITFPLRSSSSVNPYVKNFPLGMQYTIFGPTIALGGQLGNICLFQEPLTSSLIRSLYEIGKVSKLKQRVNPQKNFEKPKNFPKIFFTIL